ncbi:MAG: hypothetical protein LBR76_07595 [Oscillospiraceae bacterium]|jgi:hypothetical protein|nr:hypothetical protein [Oscillospiraceae bacterium]
MKRRILSMVLTMPLSLAFLTTACSSPVASPSAPSADISPEAQRPAASPAEAPPSEEAPVPVPSKPPATPPPAPNNPFSTKAAYTVAPVMPTDNVNPAETVLGLFWEILNENLIVDSTSPADRDGFRMVLQHTLWWELSADAGDSQISYSSINVSESQGYGMLMLAYMSGCEEWLNSKGYTWIYDCVSLQQYYDAMLRTVQRFPSSIGPNLFTWELFGYRDAQHPEGYEVEDGIKKAPFYQDPADADSALDGDMDIIYSLLLADKQWGSDGRFNYRQIALTMLGDLWDYCVHKEYKTLLLGDWASRTRDTVLNSATRSSDFILTHLAAYAAADPDHDWNAVLEATCGVIADVRDAENALGEAHQNGLLPDFIIRDAETGKWAVPAGYVLEGNDGDFSYNACRVPWRLGAYYMLYGDIELGNGDTLYNACIAPMDTFARGWANFGGSGSLSNFGPVDLTGSSGNYGYTEPTLFAPPFLVTAAATGGSPEWVELFYTGGAAEFTGDTYSDYIKLLVLLTASGNWWLP